MKKTLLLMLTLLVLGFAAAPVSAQNVLTVADGTTTNAYVPIYGYWADEDQHNQIIYPESMLGDMMNGSISSMTFYLTSSPSWGNSVTVSLGITQETSFSSSSHDTSSTIQVYSGTISIANNQLTFTFSSPFSYSGGNLLFDIVVTGDNYSGGSFYGVSSTTASICQYYYGTSTQDFIPKTSFTYTGGALCKTPSNVTVSNISTTTADVAWTGDLNASSYNVQYMLSTETDWTNALTATATDSMITLSGLQPSSTYKVRVQTACSDNTETGWSSVATFQTGCDAITITSSWFENFDSYPGSEQQPFLCWATPMTSTYNAPFVYCGYAPSCHSGSNSAELKGNNGETIMLVLPEFTNALNTLQVSFWATATNTSYGILEVGVLSDVDDMTTFEVVDTTGAPSSRNGVGNLMGPFSLLNVTSTTGRIALRFTSNSYGLSWNLDDFTVEPIPDCASPNKTSVTATDIDGHNATISWVDVDESHSAWIVYYKKTIESVWNNVPATSTSLTLTSLDPETAYEVYVITDCGTTETNPDATVTIQFTTDVACPAPTAVTASPVYINDATITWSSSASSFNVEYGENGFTQGTGTVETVSDTFIVLSNLNPETSYTVYVQADCSGDNDGLSTWSSVNFTTLPSCPKPTAVTATNVTDNSADIVWTPGYQESEWELRYGQENFNPDTSSVSEIVTGTPLFQMQNLPDDTRYDVYVRSICSTTDTSDWSSRMTFKTRCMDQDLPYTENFDSYPDWYSPDCWQKFETANMSGWGYIQGSSVYSGSKSLYIGANYSASSQAYLRLPHFSTSDITELQVKLMAKRTSGTRPLVIGISPEFSNVDSVYVLASLEPSSTYDQYVVSLESYPGTDGYIVVGTPSDISSYTAIYVDDLTVEVRPTCMYPTNFVVDSVSETSVSLSWTELGTAESWNVEYGPVGFTQGTGTTEVASDTTAITIENLEQSTAYDFYVQSDCDVIGSQWVGPLTVVTSQYMMGVTGSDTITTCGMAIYDNGGPDNDYGYSCDYTLVVYPANEGSGLQISGSGSLYVSSYYGGTLTFYDGVGTDGTQLASYTGNFTASVASAGPITIHFTSGSYYSASGFELIAQCTDCFPPANVTISDISMTGATVTWSGAASEYSVLATSAVDTVYATTTDTSYTFTTLTSATPYSVRVRSLCGSDSSLASTAVSFNTSCDQITVTETTPWTENFEGYSNHNFVCWETPVTYTANNGTFPMVYCGYSQSCHSGSNSAEVKGPELLLVLPEFSNDIHDLRLSFWATATSTSTGKVEVGVITNIMDPTTFEVVVADAGTPGPRGYQDGVSGNGNFMGPFDFNGALATTGRIALRYTDATASTTPGMSAQSWNLDDFTVSIAPDCPSPVKTSVTATNVDGHNATISWTDNDATHTAWTVYYKESADSIWNTEAATDTTVTLTNLDPETTYDVYVITNCGTVVDNPDATQTIQFTTAVACPAPTDLTVSNVAVTSATVTWVGSADSYTIEYGETGFTPGSGTTMTVTGNTTDLTGLTAGTSYLVYVAANCGQEGLSELSSVIFMTACDVVTSFPYTESFENGLGCWQSTESTDANYAWTTSSSDYYYNSGADGSSFALARLNNYTDATVRLLSPIFDLTSVTDPYVKFSHIQLDWGGDQDEMSVYYRASVSDSWTLLVSYTNSIANWTYDSLALPSPSATYQISFVASNSYGHGVGVDHIQLYDNSGSTPVLTDPTVSTTAATSVEQTTATLNGTITNPDNVTITAKGFEWKATAGGTYTPVTVTGDELTYNLTGLTANTGYTYKAFITFDSTTVYGDEVTFATLPEDTPEPCDVPTGLHTTSVENESIAIAWDANADVSSWNIQYRPEGGTYASASSTTNSYTITGLTGLTTYEIQVQAVCADGQTSDWSTAITATTTNVGIEEHLMNSISLYPNPAKEMINVQCTMYNEQWGGANVEVFDVYGKLLQTVRMDSEMIQLNVSGLADGMYFVRVTTEQGVATKTFVKK